MVALIVSGKRKRSVARVIVKEGTGKIIVNKLSHELLPQLHKLMVEEPLRIAKEKLGDIKYDFTIVLKSGGRESQIEAARLAIARALVKVTKSNDLKKTFVAYDRNMLVADIRRKEPYKPGDSKARSKRQKSYR